jgi:hypothetical protein
VHWYAPQFSDAVTGLLVALIAYVALEGRPVRSRGA